jgi:hypothetical protein
VKCTVRNFALALLIGTLLGFLVSLLLTRVKDQSDWRASEITAWCNRYRADVTSSQQRLELLLAALSPAFPKNDEYWFLKVDERDYEVARQILAIQRETRSIEPWLIRCASRALPEMSYMDAMPGAGYDLLSYFKKVLDGIPERDPTDPEQYVQPLDEPERHFSAY